MYTATSPLFKSTLRNVLWDGRVMAIMMEDFDVVEAAEGSFSCGSNIEQGPEFVSRLHIMVAMKVWKWRWPSSGGEAKNRIW